MTSTKSPQTTGSRQRLRTNRLLLSAAWPLLAALLLALLGCAGQPPTPADRSDTWQAPLLTPALPVTAIETQTQPPTATAPPATAPPATAPPATAPSATATALLQPSRTATAIVEATIPARLDGLPVITQAQLPREARDTIALIKRGGPFPYRQDDSVFQNRERRLPLRARGYYREYTVRTPGSADRGARRIVVGQGGEFYYTQDHYNSFMRIWDP